MTARQVFIQELSSQLLLWSKNLECEHLGACFAVMPLRDIIAVRDNVIKDCQYSLLVDGLLEGLKHTEPPVRYNCAVALDHVADERCTKPLRELLNDPVARVRRAALHSLSCDACKVSPLPHSNDLTEILTEMALTDPSIRVRREAVNSLAASCDVKALPVLKKLLEEKDVAMQRTAHIALKRQQAL
jgi:HEAT repeat protein